MVFEKLEDWSKRSEEAVKYFSGTATYRNVFHVGAEVCSLKSVVLDLGRVAVMASVRLNGRDLGIVWKQPYRLEITGALKEGDNTLEVDVVNLWINRMIGDERLAEDSERKKGELVSWPQWVKQEKPSPSGRRTFTTWRLYEEGDPLVESGLLGPITIKERVHE